MPDPYVTSVAPVARGAAQAGPPHADLSARVGTAPEGPPVPYDSPGRRPVDRHDTAILRLGLRLSRDKASVGLARRILDSVLDAMGTGEQCRDDLALALSEGCANAVQHAVGSDGYEVRVSFEERCCVVDILDNGQDVLRPPLNRSTPHTAGEQGRGLSIMAVSTDSLHLAPRRPHGLAVRFTKRLT